MRATTKGISSFAGDLAFHSPASRHLTPDFFQRSSKDRSERFGGLTGCAHFPTPDFERGNEWNEPRGLAARNFLRVLNSQSLQLVSFALILSKSGNRARLGLSRMEYASDHDEGRAFGTPLAEVRWQERA